MERNLVCSECGGKMEQGWIPLKDGKWSPPYDFLYLVDGEPGDKKGGLYSTSERIKYDIIVYRCEKCGFLKMYTDEEKKK